MLKCTRFTYQRHIMINILELENEITMNMLFKQDTKTVTAVLNYNKSTGMLHQV